MTLLDTWVLDEADTQAMVELGDVLLEPIRIAVDFVYPFRSMIAPEGKPM
jgi:hypothetical protein